MRQTFLNLPTGKQNRIICAAIDEFSRFPYPKTSVNRIVEGAGIPKGSFYQYFENKDDLYIYCVFTLARKIMQSQAQNQKGLLTSTFRRTAEMGIPGILELRERETVDAVGEKGFQVMQGIMEAPVHLRSAAILKIAREIYQPAFKAELEADPAIRPGADIDYFAYLFSISELIAVQYWDGKDMDIRQMNTNTYEYLKAIYDHLQKNEARR